MAIASLGDPELKQLEQEAEELSSRQAQLTAGEYAKANSRVWQTLEIFYDADKLNAPIVICNNVANVVVTAFMPLALKSAQPPVFKIGGFSFTPILAGSETLTFFLTLIFIVILGEIVPKRLGMTYALWFVKNFRGFIRLINLLFGWIGLSFVSVVEIPVCVWRQIKALVP